MTANIVGVIHFLLFDKLFPYASLDLWAVAQKLNRWPLTLIDLVIKPLV